MWGAGKELPRLDPVNDKKMVQYYGFEPHFEPTLPEDMLCHAKKHLKWGFYTLIPYFLTVLALHRYGLILEPDLPWFTFLGAVALIMGSDLPDIDSRSSTIHELFLFFFPTAVLWVSLSFFGYSMLTFIATLGSVVVFTQAMPEHRGFMHTASAGFTLSSALFLACHFLLGVEIRISMWLGISLLAGYLIHLVLDGNPKI